MSVIQVGGSLNDRKASFGSIQYLVKAGLFL